jgi:hypothetical protein
MRFCDRLIGLTLFALLVVVPSSAAQSQQRYVLGTTVSFNEETQISLERKDFVGRPSSTTHLEEHPYTAAQRTHSKIFSPGGIPRGDSTPGHLLAPIGLGVAGGALGLLAGGTVGTEIAEGADCSGMLCGLSNLVYGALIGETVGLSSGVYLGTKRRGSYLLTVLGGTLGTAAVVTLAGATDSPEMLLLGPVVQFGVTIPIARSTR